MTAVNHGGNNKMNGKAVTWLGIAYLVLAAIGVSSADNNQRPEQPAAPITTKAQPASGEIKAVTAESARKTCLNQCNVANGQCNSEVRQARQQCSRNAASNGRDPMTMRNNDYTYFCSYFRNPGRRGRGNVDARFDRHYDLCVNVMQRNIASMRYDCYRNERDAQNICRAELRDCQAECQ